jgi:hypothetical protein
MKTLKVLKYFIAFIILANIQLVVNSQTYYPLVDTNKVWSNLIQATSPPMTSETNFIKFSGDTIIGLNSYKNVFQSDDSQHAIWTLIGFIREDITHKVYYYKIQDTAERILYDFGANIGDTIHVGGEYGIDLVISSIDSVYIFDRYRKRLWAWDEPWIVGIGSICGVMESGTFYQVGGINRLLCFYENDTLKFLNPDFNSCYISNVNIDATTKDNFYFELYPNPPDELLYFKTNLLNNVTLQFYNVLGNNILFKNIKNEDHLYLDKSIFHSGIYFYHVYNNGIIVKTGKLVIQ